MTRNLTRRGFIGGVAGSAGLALAGCAASSSGSKSPAGARTAVAHEVQRFVSRPDLTPPVVSVTGSVPESVPGYIFIAPNGPGPAQSGGMILSVNGDLIWFSPGSGATERMDLNAQVYRGQHVLTWFQGPVTAAGIGEGAAVIASSDYRQQQVVNAANGLKVDLHEFALTPEGTALITAYRLRPADLSAVGGPANGYVLSGVAQEIDVATGALLFEWDSLDHVPVTDSYEKFVGGTKTKPFDYFHINSIAVDTDGDLLISSRNTWTVYKVSRPSGQVAWRLGGKQSSFTMGPGARFYWQHYARPVTTSVLSIFDDGAAPAEETKSRAIVLDLDTSTMQATLAREYVHPEIGGGKEVLAGYMGSAQVLPDSSMFVGWGSVARFSLFNAAGHVILDGVMPANYPSYRAFLQDWTARPAEAPAVVARPRTGGATVYASWNGATEVATWQVLAGTSPDNLSLAASAPRSGFETAISVDSAGPYFAAVPCDLPGRELSRSATVKLD
jgi:Arylsulfotransferase (ASST)